MDHARHTVRATDEENMMKHYKRFAALLAAIGMTLTAVAVSPAIAKEEPQGPRSSEAPATAGQATRDSTDGIEDGRVAQEATAGADSAPLSAPPSGIPAPDSDADRSSNSVQSDVTFCYYGSRVDKPHISRNQQDVSAHGWWQYYNGDCKTATVRIWLYHYRCVPGTNDCIWQFTAYDKVKKMPRNAPLYMRANARHSCVSKARKVGFKAVVDVDIDDLSDPPDRVTKFKDVYCVPWW